MSTFADSSALVRLYVDDPDADRVRTIADLAVSEIARVEVASALWRKARDGAIGPDDAVTLEGWFAADWHGDGAAPPRFAVVASTGSVVERAAALVSRHALRSMDAVQLASALAARDADPELQTFACFDRHLAAAAATEGFAALP